jgi:hypothetical protein
VTIPYSSRTKYAVLLYFSGKQELLRRILKLPAKVLESGLYFMTRFDANFNVFDTKITSKTDCIMTCSGNLLYKQANYKLK